MLRADKVTQMRDKRVLTMPCANHCRSKLAQLGPFCVPKVLNR